MTVSGPGDPPPGTNDLDRAIRKARLAEAAHFDAIVDIRDASTLRLQVLMDGLRPVLSGRPDTTGFVDLSLVPGFPPRLWVDMVSYVIMAPDARTYRFQRDVHGGHEVLFESFDRAEMTGKITDYVAHRLIERQRLMAGATRDAPTAVPSYSGTTLILAWLSGFALGVLLLFVALVLLSKMP
ncbi:MAG: hypothetical protein AB7S41_06225 [Parvibaculaceae bacterium]